MPQMPDTRISLGGMPSGGGQGSPGGPLGTLGAMMQIKEKQLALETARRQAELDRRTMEDDDETRSALQQYERPEEAIDHLWKGGRATAAEKLAKSVYSARTNELAAADARLKTHANMMGQVSQILDSVNDDATLKSATPALLALTEPSFGKGVRDLIPTTYTGNEARVKQLAQMGKTMEMQAQEKRDMIARQQNAYLIGQERGPDQIDPVTGEKRPGMWSHNGQLAIQAYTDNMARDLGSAPNKQVYDERLQLHWRHGTPREVIERFPPWLEDGSAPERARQIGLTSEQQAELSSRTRREDRLDAIAAKGMTEAQERVVYKTRDDDDKDTEAMVRTVYENEDAKKVPKASWVTDARGIQVPPPFELKHLSAEHKAEYVRQRLQAEDNERKALNRPSLVEAAKGAVKRGDVEGYEKTKSVYDNLTKGLSKPFEEVVPWPKSTPAAKPTPKPGATTQTPAAGGPAVQPAPALTQGPASRPNEVAPKPTTAALIAQAVALAAEKSAERDPVKRAALTQKMLKLFGM